MVSWPGGRLASMLARMLPRMLTVPVLLASGTGASAQTMLIASLSDVSFGTISSVASGVSSSQTLCVYSSLQSYTIKATGSGTGGAFTLGNVANSAAQLPYTVQWAFAGGQTSGTALTAGQGLRGTPALLNLICGLNLLSSNASLIVTLPAASLSAAQSGAYTGTLSLMVSPN